jgi:hypothetical protein
MFVDVNAFMSVRHLPVTGALFIGNSVTSVGPVYCATTTALQRYSDASRPSYVMYHQKIKDVHNTSLILVWCVYVACFSFFNASCFLTFYLSFKPHFFLPSSYLCFFSAYLIFQVGVLPISFMFHFLSFCSLCLCDLSSSFLSSVLLYLVNVFSHSQFSALSCRSFPSFHLSFYSIFIPLSFLFHSLCPPRLPQIFESYTLAHKMQFCCSSCNSESW